MNFNSRYLPRVLPILIFISSCSGLKTVNNDNTVVPTIETSNIQEQIPLYQKTESRMLDIIHTKLLVDFNWQKKQMNGEAFLTVKPYYYSLDSISLDAKAMEVKSIKVAFSNYENQEVEFINTGRKIKFKLPKTLTRNDTLNLQIKYVANPENVTDGGSSAISMAKGLYFINADKKDKNKPQQVWTLAGISGPRSFSPAKPGSPSGAWHSGFLCWRYLAHASDGDIHQYDFSFCVHPRSRNRGR